MIPIWKDTYLTIDGNLSPFSYSIWEKDSFSWDDEGNEVWEDKNIFNGKAWVKPDAENIKIKINEICSNYLKPQDVDFEQTKIRHTEAIKTFYVTNLETNETIDTFTFIYDWSYGERILNQPITKKWVNGMYCFKNYNADGNLYTDISLTKPTDYVEVCGEWALYYVNRCGGWDSLLIEGNVKKKDSYTRFQKMNNIDNNTKEFETKTFQTNITTSYTATTGWLNDEQSNILAANVFSTQLAYLHNLKTEEIIPVNINDADAEYKTFKGNGRKLVNYTINLISAQTQKIR